MYLARWDSPRFPLGVRSMQEIYLVIILTSLLGKKNSNKERWLYHEQATLLPTHVLRSWPTIAVSKLGKIALKKKKIASEYLD